MRSLQLSSQRRVHVEEGSVFGAALLVYVDKKFTVMPGFAGQVYLCDFVDEKMGPAGTEITQPRSYDFEQISTRTFVRDSIKAFFPKEEALVDVTVDPGEYGLENYTCRVLCVFLFIISIQEEFFHIVQMARLLIYVPTVNDSWVGFSEPPEDESPRDQDFLVAVRGMPMGWKIWNGIFMFFPQCVLWWWTACCDTLFLMATASIDNMIVNSVAMSFLLTIDNLIIQNLMGVKSMYLMEKADEYIIGDTPKPAGAERSSCFQILDLAFWKFSALMLTLVLTVAMVYIYGDSHCDYENGRWISKPVYLPDSISVTASSSSRVSLSAAAYELGSNRLCSALSDVRSEGECLDIASPSQSYASFKFSSLIVSSV